MIARKTSLTRRKSTLKRVGFCAKTATGAKKKKTSVKKADALFSKWIRERDGKCVRCGKTEYLQCSHFWPRAIAAVRFDPENCDALCYGCHYGDRYHGWEYAKQGEYRSFKIKQLGEERYLKLEEKANTFMKQADAVKDVMNMLSAEIQKTNEHDNNK